jgi:hypothetical protein
MEIGIGIGIGRMWGNRLGNGTGQGSWSIRQIVRTGKTQPIVITL